MVTGKVLQQVQKKKKMHKTENESTGNIYAFIKNKQIMTKKIHSFQ